MTRARRDWLSIILVLIAAAIIIFFVGRRVMKAKECEDKGGVYVVVNDPTRPAFDACIIAKRVD